MAIHSDTPTRARPVNYTALTEVLLLGGMAALLLIKWLRGNLDFYIHPRYTALMLVSAVVLLLMAGARLRAVYSDRPAATPGWIYLLLAIPLLFGTLVPARPLGASTLASRGLDVGIGAPATSWQPDLAADTSEWNLLQWSTALSFSAELQGRPVEVVGFVFPDQRLGSDAFYVVRYVITCCAADGAGVGLPVVWAGGAGLPADQWVRVSGSLGSIETPDGAQPAIIATAVSPVGEPDEPYLYP